MLLKFFSGLIGLVLSQQLYAEQNLTSATPKQDNPAELIRVSVLTEEWRPFNYFEDGKLQGICTEIVEQTLNNAEIPYHMELLPWQRAYKQALRKANTLLFTTNRTRNRERLFKWIGPLIVQDLSFMKLADREDIVVTTLAKLKDYRLGAAQGGSVHGYLVQNGFIEGDDFVTYSDEVQGLKMLEAGRVDMIPGSRYTKAFQEQFLEKSKLAKAYTLHVADYYLAANLETPDEIVASLQKQLDLLIESGFREKTIQKYEKMSINPTP